MLLYILENKTVQRFYIGITLDIERRLFEHNANSSHYTGRLEGTWELVYKKNFKSKVDARIEEQRLKRAKNKKYIQWYIKNVL